MRPLRNELLGFLGYFEIVEPLLGRTIEPQLQFFASLEQVDDGQTTLGWPCKKGRIVRIAENMAMMFDTIDARFSIITMLILCAGKTSLNDSLFLSMPYGLVFRQKIRYLTVRYHDVELFEKLTDFRFGHPATVIERKDKGF